MKRIKIFFSVCFIFSMLFLACSENNITDGGGEEVTHSNDITQDETWGKGTHYVDGWLSVTNAVLTIEPGATIVFKAGARLYIGENGGLIADGTNETITFTGEQKQNGYWYDVELAYNAISSKCILKNVVMEYGGGYSANSYMLSVNNNATIMNCTFRYSSSNGVSIGENINPTFTDNIITGCTGYPITMDFTSCNCLQLGTGSLQGNGKDYALLDASTLNQDATLHKIDVPYRFDGWFSIESPGTLTIEAGSVCEMNSGAEIYVGDGAGLIAVGTPTDSIYFTGAVKQPGYWYDIEFAPNASNINSKLQYVVIEYGGGYSQNSQQLLIGNDALVQNCNIRFSSSYGCKIESDAYPVFSNNTLTGNAKAPLYVYFSNVGLLNLKSCNFSGNTEAFIYVDMNQSSQDGLLGKTTIPYLFDGWGLVTNNTTFTIEPGVTIQMASGAEINVDAGSTLIADGTNEMITITGQVQQAGYWDHIEFYLNASNNSKLINCKIEYGGGYSANSGLILVKNAPTITSCILQYSSSNGIVVYSSGSAANITGNTFNNINGVDIYFP